jgi:hypothetical protein
MVDSLKDVAGRTIGGEGVDPSDIGVNKELLALDRLPSIVCSLVSIAHSLFSWTM